MRYYIMIAMGTHICNLISFYVYNFTFNQFQNMNSYWSFNIQCDWLHGGYRTVECITESATDNLRLKLNLESVKQIKTKKRIA